MVRSFHFLFLLLDPCLVRLPVADDSEEFKMCSRRTILGLKGIEAKHYFANKTEYRFYLRLICKCLSYSSGA